jgi:hypothetical protein
MKTLVAGAIAFIAGALVMSPSEIDLLGGYCCDEAAVIHCKVEPMERPSSPCRCLGLNDGHVCL